MSKRLTRGNCPLCQRFCRLTFHHLIPRKLHRRPRFRRRFEREQLNSGIPICRLCHNGIHDRYDEVTLGTQFTSLEKLRADADLQKHFVWVSKQTVRESQAG